MLLLLLMFTVSVLTEIEYLDDFGDSDNSKLKPIFDWRNRSIPECRHLIFEVPEQSKRCGDCWAHTTIGALSSTVCIASNGENRTSFSVMQLLTRTINPVRRDNCQGGTTYYACDYLSSHEMVSGSTSKKRNTGCWPYELSLCKYGSLEPDCPPNGENFYAGNYTRKPDICPNPGHVWQDEKSRKIDKCIYITGNDTKTVISNIETNISMYGPLKADIQVTERFTLYKAGVYQEKIYNDTTNHVVQLLGWGKRGGLFGVKYWIAANAWGSTWGDRGFFYIRQEKWNLNINTRVVRIKLATTSSNYFEPNPATIHRKLAVAGAVMDCFSLSGGRKCSHGLIVDSRMEILLDFACFERHSDAALNLLGRYKTELLIFDDMEYEGIARKARIPRQCTNTRR